MEYYIDIKIFQIALILSLCLDEKYKPKILKINKINPLESIYSILITILKEMFVFYSRQGRYFIY